MRQVGLILTFILFLLCLTFNLMILYGKSIAAEISQYEALTGTQILAIKVYEKSYPYILSISVLTFLLLGLFSTLVIKKYRLSTDANSPS